MKNQKIVLGILTIFLLVGNIVLAQIPEGINYQGYLTNSAGDPVTDGVYQISFTIYGSESGTDSYWTSGIRPIQVVDGAFTYILGSEVSFGCDVWIGDSTRYLGITVAADPEISPRVKLLSVPYAHHAAYADQVKVPVSISMNNVIDPVLNVYNMGAGGAIYGSCSAGWAGYFTGDCRVTGTFDNSKSAMRIDHPLDPENKILEHAYINSPEMLTVYSGNVATNANGEAVVSLPDYFESLNKDFRYQLTVIGSFAQAIIKDKISNNQFVVATSEPNVEVSWQVTGVRADAYARSNPVTVEQEKQTEEKGYYINPEAFGFDLTRSTEYSTNAEFKMQLDKRELKK